MPEYSVSFELEKPNTLSFPEGLLDAGRYKVVMDERLGVTISGNRDGLLYLAEVLVRCAISGYDAGFHVHLSLDSSTEGPNIDCSPELTLYAAEQ